MGNWRNIVQKNFAQGIDAVSQVFDQGENSVPQLQGMVFTTNKSLRSIDGTAMVGTDVTNTPPYKPVLAMGSMDWQGVPSLVGVSTVPPPFYLWLRWDVSAAGVVATPTGLALASANVAGGLLVPGNTYSYKVTAIDTHGETIATAAVAIVLAAANNAVTLTWNEVDGAVGYNVYGRTAGAEKLIQPTGREGGWSDNQVATVSSAFTSFTDKGTTAPTSNPPGANDTTVTTGLYKGSAIGGNYGNLLLKRFPGPFTGTIQPWPGPVRGTWGGGGASSSFNNNTVNGGLFGRSSMIPQFIRMRSRMIIALGNGTPPYSYQFDSGSGDFAAFPLGSATANLPPTAQNVPYGMAHGAFINGFLWAFNTWPTDETVRNLDGPSALRQSNLNDPDNWNAANSTFISKDDGQEGMGIATFSIAEAGIAPQTNVVLFKNFSTYLATPTLISAANFAIQQAQTDQGCSSPRSIQFVPKLGIVRRTHLGISAFDGLRDTPISEPIHPYIFGDIPSNSTYAVDFDYACYANSFRTTKPLMYCIILPATTDRATYGAGAMTLLFCYDVEQGAWSVTKLDSALGIVCFAGGETRFEGQHPISLMGGFSDGIIRRWQAGDLTTEAGGGVAWSFITRQVFGNQGASQRLYVRKNYVRGFGTGTINTIGVQVNGGDNPDNNAPRPTNADLEVSGGNRWTYRHDVGETVLDMNATISGSGPVEIDTVEWEVKDKPVGIVQAG